MLNEPAYYRHGRAEIAGVARRAARPSYVGEAGWKLTCPIDGVVSVYELLHRAGARPVGLLAQTSMRMEKGFLA